MVKKLVIGDEGPIRVCKGCEDYILGAPAHQRRVVVGGGKRRYNFGC